ncbi:MAG: peroxidase-related enzyme [Bacteroidales bacterium]
MPRIRVIPHNEASGRLKEIYDKIMDSRGKLADVHQIQSLRPESICRHMDLYMEIMYSRSELSRAERELIGTVVSMENGCKYCTTHHAQALQQYWKDQSKMETLTRGAMYEVLSAREAAICRFSMHLTRHPGAHEDHDYTKDLKNIGLSDSAILDIVLVTAYFNFVNRIVLSLGVELEPDKGTGYKYE